ncbi:Lipid A biosynthesis lauroyl acyltransferase [Roseibacterium elongatum DSM 19469]|uniref:Lipid A biosynthesis lauroyl acyltransferase n=1 Tax=Roseicyclus elongatus DSM 19469 TaxID=1294273 RepID=W8S5N6_9RHOB|nr:lysophospholipid acyltransferase family protein [Roseibacterium elongatum]AHM05532.1 Lipid A biosynthesis lauroyl acyltransferase [Roseibacterium elongatum DSM 19469]
MSKKNRTDWLDRLSDAAFRGTVAAIRLVPWRWRIPAMGAFMARIVGPIAGYRRRAEAHLAYIYPDMPPAERRRIARAALDNIGRTIIENYSPKEQIARYAGLTPQGAGWPVVARAQEEGRPMLFVTGHFGNWQVGRVALNARGLSIGGLYRPFNNPYANAHYVWSVEAVGGTAYSRDRRGLAAFLKTLRQGGQAAMMLDQYVSDGAFLTFMGKEALTSLSAAEMALRHDALLVPIYCPRLPDGQSFAIEIEAPIPPGTPEEMTQALNDSLEAQIRARPEQWFWIHRRWKPERLEKKKRRRRAAAAAGKD